MTLGTGIRSRKGILIIVVVLGLVVAACGGDTASTTTEAEEAPTTTASGPTTTGGSTDTTAPPVDTRWGMTPDEEAAWQEIEAAAAEEGTVVYYSVGSVPAEQVDLLLTAFAEDYPDIQIEFVPAGNNAAIVSRITTEQESGAVVGDVADFSVGNALRLPPEFFEDFTAPVSGDPEAEWAFDPVVLNEGRAVQTNMMAQYFGFWYNTDLVAEADAPKDYMELCDPIFRDNAVSRQFWSTGGGNHTYTIATQTYGEDWVSCMQEQNLTFAENQDEALLSVARGEFGLGIGLTGRQATQLISEGLPIWISWPEDINLRVTNGIAIQTDAPHPNAAKVFANWMLSQGGQELWQQLGQFPVNKNVPPGEEWMQGYDNSEIFFENLTGGDELQANLDKAMSEFGGG